VKVDREERPDVDALYMDAVMAVSGSGGWPMTVWCTPDGRPFYAGTYFPKTAHPGRASFVDVCRAVEDAWANRRDAVEAQADELLGAVRERSSLTNIAVRSEVDADPVAVVRAGVEQLLGGFDDEWGGFGSAPKFPQPSWLDLTLRAAVDGEEDVRPRAVHALRTTLDAMASGGIYDHLGGGFARYSTDRQWLVPHFEKMLYDQAGLLRVYARAWQLLREPAWRQVCAETVAYVERDLAQPGGGISSAEDADAEGVEGRFSVWSLEEVREVGGDAAVEWYGVTAAGSWEGTNILWRPVRGDLMRPPELERARAALFERRERRVRPGLDDKVLTEWNAMWAAALAEAGAVLDEQAWVAAAARTMDFLHEALVVDGRWRRSWQGDGGARHDALAQDLAWVVDACTRLYEATGEQRWLERSVAAAEALVDGFWDDTDGGFFTVAAHGEQLLVRQKDTYDSATPSANSVAATALLRLGGLTGDDRWTAHGHRTLDALSPLLTAAPLAGTGALCALAFAAAGSTEIVITGDRPDLVAEVRARLLPDAVVAWGERGTGPLWEGRDLEGAAYVCRSYACQRPVTSADDLSALLMR
jgi:hypothetical protein